MKEFFAGIWTFFASIWEWGKRIVTDIWTWIISIIALLFVPINRFLVWVNDFLVLFNENINHFTEYMEGQWGFLKESFSPLAHTFADVNLLFPISHVFSCMTFLCFLWVISLGYRFIKSLIPTLS